MFREQKTSPSARQTHCGSASGKYRQADEEVIRVPVPGATAVIVDSVAPSIRAGDEFCLLSILGM